MRNKKFIILAGIASILILGGVLYFGTAIGGAITPKPFTDLIGTRVASTTSGVAWYGKYVASTTYPFDVSGVSQAGIVFDVTGASTTAGIQFNILGSNDPGCSTATTSTIYNLLTKNEVRWFDASDYLNLKTAITTLPSATTTYLWSNPKQGIAREIHLTNLNMQCLAVEVNASSTILHAGYKLKD